MAHSLTPTVLFVGANPHVLQLLEKVTSVVADLRLKHCQDIAEVPPLIWQMDLALVVVHVERPADQEAVVELLRELGSKDLAVACVLVLEEGVAEKKNEFLRAGAACCLPSDVTLRKLTHVIECLTFLARGLDAEPIEPREELNPIVVECDASFYVSEDMAPMIEQIRRVVSKDTTILFTGETGTGKTRLARLIHDMSPRCREPFLIVDCNSLASSLIESELFGHAKGAFTGAERAHEGKLATAGKGTVVLDEINSLPLSVQSKLLRVIGERVFEPVGSVKSQPLEARLITISNACLDQAVTEGSFRADLYYRLNVVGFHLPRLRDRLGAIAPLAKRFLAQFAAKSNPEKIGITADALRALERYQWSGNIRELGNVIERAVSLFPGPMIELGHLPEALRAHDAQLALSAHSPQEPPALTLHKNPTADELTLMHTKEKAEILRITEALRKHRNNRLRTAAELGISRMALYKKLHKYGLYHTA